MALRQSSRLFGGIQRVAQTSGVESSACVTFFKRHASSIEERGRSEENVSFRKEDERLLRQLLSKVKHAADKVDVHGAESSKNVEMLALKEILGKYNVSDDDLEKIIKWKHASA